MANVLGIDVGYGHTKWVATSSDGGDTKKGIFPSVAPVTLKERTAEAAGMSGLRTVTVRVGDQNYVVGRDAYHETEAYFARSLLPDYSKTDGYHALMLGALSLSGLREIDQLVIGLPLTTLATHHAALSEKYLGEHAIGASYARRKVDVLVRHVNVTSQPAGAMLHAVAVKPELRKSKNLVIDIGYFTMDFLMCEGLRPFYKRSGAIHGGMSAFYDRLSSVVADKFKTDGIPNHGSIDHFRLEEALAQSQSDGMGSRFSIQAGKREVDITDCVAIARPKLTEHLDRMVSTLGSESLGVISTIVLAGGGAKVMLPSVQAMLGDSFEITTLPNSQFAIASGYAQLGQASVRRAPALTE